MERESAAWMSASSTSAKRLRRSQPGFPRTLSQFSPTFFKTLTQVVSRCGLGLGPQMHHR